MLFRSVVMTAAALASPLPSATDTATPISLPPPTPVPNEQYTIAYLRRRTYGGGSFEIVNTMKETDQFTRYLIRYPSDGLAIYGFMNIPKGGGPFAVIIAIHGYEKPLSYKMLDSDTDTLDNIARNGFIVIHPNLRNYPPSDYGDDLFRVGTSIDVLNLIALIKTQGKQPGALEKAYNDRIGLWGHSMGGEIGLRVLTVSSDIKAAVLYASLSGDEAKNARLLYRVNQIGRAHV